MYFATLITLLLSTSLLFCKGRASSSNLHLHRNLGPIPLLGARDLPTGTCNANTPCVNAACCGTNGLCGYSPTECGSGNCTSNCNAKAECGQYGTPGSQNCPLNVCCSQFGFCGETSDFCGKSCQAGYGGCGDVNRPSCGGGSSVNKRTIGYYETWSNTRKCQAVSPEDLNLNGFTHINFAFAFFDPSTFQIAPMDSNAASLYNRFTGLKSTSSGLQTWLSVGGWSFTDPGATRSAFGDMSSSASNRQTFITGLIKFMDTYGFDGVDLDWEYPAADDRGGVPADKENYVSLVKDMRSAFGSKYGISMTLPTSFWYLQHFDLANIQSSVDWFNFMAYDLHGTWDAQSKFVGPYIAPHTNVTEIDAGLDLLWRAGVTPDKVTMGMGWYGRSFTLKDPSCNTPNRICEFTGGANPGPCSDASGILDYQEIQDVISKNGLTPVHDEAAAVKWITWDSNQWVSYDDPDTFQQKRAFANSRCLGGLMVWAMDQMDQSQSNGFGPAPGVTASQQSDANQGSADRLAQKVCYTSDCGAGCKSGETEVAQMNGQPGQVSTSERCSSSQYESLCCADGTTMGTCTWRGFRGVGLSCIGGCATGETEVARNTNHHDPEKGDYTCHGGQQSYCCSGFKAASAKSQLAQAAEDAAKEAAEAAAEQAALDIAAKAFCRVAVPALLAPLELLEDLIPIVGEILDIAEVAATPALIKLCTDEIEKEGKAEFKVFGKEHSLSFDKPTKTPTETRPPESTHESASEKTSSSCAANKKRVNLRVLSTTTTITESTQIVTARTCAGNLYPQACLHYRSVINRDPLQYGHLTCTDNALNAPRPVVNIYNDQHDGEWITGWMQAYGLDCQRDEFPPAIIWQGRNNNQWIRLVPGLENTGAGSLFRGICKDPPDSHTTNLQHLGGENNGCRSTEHYRLTKVITRPVLSLAFDAMPLYPDDGITQNPCWPSTLIPEDPGFALLLQDPWYNFHVNDRIEGQHYYSEAPGPFYTQGKVPRFGYNKRDGVGGTDGGSVDPDEILVHEGNSTRKATDEELLERFGYLRCADESCSAERDALGLESAIIRGEPKTVVPHVAAATTAVQVSAEPTLTSSPEIRVTSADLPRMTLVSPSLEELKREVQGGSL